VVHPHTPNVSTPEGFLDFIAVGTLLQMGYLLNRKYYKNDFTQEEADEDAASRLAFLKYMAKFGDGYGISIQGTPVPIMALVDYALVIFAAGAVRLKARVHKGVPNVEGCSFLRFRKAVESFMEQQFAGMTAYYQTVLRKDIPFLWTHPDIEIAARDTIGLRKTAKTHEDAAFLRSVMFDGPDIDEDEYWDSAEGTFYSTLIFTGCSSFFWHADDEEEDSAEPNREEFSTKKLPEGMFHSDGNISWP
jgi:hypothetical protein